MKQEHLRQWISGSEETGNKRGDCEIAQLTT